MEHFSLNGIGIKENQLVNVILQADTNVRQCGIASPPTPPPWQVMLFGCFDRRTKKIRSWDVRINVSPLPVLLLRNVSHVVELCHTLDPPFSGPMVPSIVPLSKRKSSSTNVYWLLIAYISNLYSWQHTRAIWHLWRNGRTRGISSRMIYGIYVYLKLVTINRTSGIEPEMNIIRYDCDEVFLNLPELLLEQLADFRCSFYRVEVGNPNLAISKVISNQLNGSESELDNAEEEPSKRRKLTSDESLAT
jgi:hypothetical protein